MKKIKLKYVAYQTKIFFTSIFLISYLPLYGVQSERQNKQNLYCNRWADRFLSIKDGQNYKKNKISAKKFPIYVGICKDHYEELRNYYKKLGDSIELEDYYDPSIRNQK